MRDVELLIPASNLEVLKVAVLYGADAVYIGGEMYGLRAKAKNFSMEDVKEGIEFAHKHGVKVYITANIVAHNEDLEGIRKYFEELKIKEIAEIFECSENTIKSRINYAKKSLEQKIQTYKQQGNTLFALPLIPFIGWILKEDAKATEIPKLVLNTSSCGFLEQIISKIKEIRETINIKKDRREKFYKESEVKLYEDRLE